ncbi:MAG TPA: RNA polymerase sigma factor, partial [Candidatus Cloacimonadota bacterium]|nr:RNA polymerase sigma factor [Candidatus Cloacimonadota bacterium]
MKTSQSSQSEEFCSLIFDNKALIIKIVRLYAHTDSDKADLEQEILLQLWKSYPGFKGLSKIETWMYRVALNTAIFNIKKRQNLFNLTKKLHNEATVFEYQDKLDETDQWELVKNGISSLSDIDKAIVHLYLEGKPYAEIA